MAIKNAANFDVNPEQPAFYPADEMALTPFSYNDYMIAIQAKRMCFMEKEDRLGITGLKDRGKGWQVPYVKCNSKLCQFDGQDARPFCEYSILAVTGANETDTGGQDRAAEFREWMYDRWPILLQQPPTQGWPLEYDFVQLFPDPSTVDTYIRRPDYGAVQVPKISMSIVFDGNSPNAYKYSLRQNSTTLNSPERTKPGRPVTVTTPPTNRLFNSFARTDLETCSRSPRDANLGPFQSSCTGQYVYNGVIATQRLVGDFILAKSGAVDAGYFVSDGGVQFVQFPQRAFNITGFFESIQGK